MPRASAIAALTALGAAQNALVPLASAAQFALCGHAGAGASAIAAYGLALASTNVATSAFNFVSDGVVAKVGAYLARKDAVRAAAAARLAVACALGAGAASCAILFALRDALFDKTFARQSKDTTAMALEVFVCRAACAPLVCAVAALRGVLGGCGRVGTATMLSALGAALETAVVASATSARLHLDGAAMMRWIGVGYVIVVIVQFLVSACVVATLPPRGASEPLGVWRARMLPRKDAFDFMSDGASMVVRSTLLQASFFIAVVIASRSFDASGLAAHHIICQLWLISKANLRKVIAVLDTKCEALLSGLDKSRRGSLGELFNEALKSSPDDEVQSILTEYQSKKAAKVKPSALGDAFAAGASFSFSFA